MNPLVAPQNGLAGKRLATNIADKRTFSRVRADMYLQAARPDEGLIANVTCIIGSPVFFFMPLCSFSKFLTIAFLLLQ